MNVLAARDAIFSELHSTVLKPLGFRKKGHWSILNEMARFRTVYLRASRWSTKEDTTFWLDVKVFRSDWFSLLWGPKAFPGPAEGTPSLVLEELNRMLSPQMKSLKIDATTDIDGLTSLLSVGMRTHAWPLLQQCSSLEGILSYYQSHNLNDRALSAAAVCVLLGRGEQAKQLMKIAKESAPHEIICDGLRFARKQCGLTLHCGTPRLNGNISMGKSCVEAFSDGVIAVLSFLDITIYWNKLQYANHLKHRSYGTYA